MMDDKIIVEDINFIHKIIYFRGISFWYTNMKNIIFILFFIHIVLNMSDINNIDPTLIYLPYWFTYCKFKNEKL